MKTQNEINNKIKQLENMIKTFGIDPNGRHSWCDDCARFDKCAAGMFDYTSGFGWNCGGVKEFLRILKLSKNVTEKELVELERETECVIESFGIKYYSNDDWCSQCTKRHHCNVYHCKQDNPEWDCLNMEDTLSALRWVLEY